MSAQTIRTALGQLQDDPDHESAWTELQNVVTSPDPGMSVGELIELLEAARQAHESRREWDAVARLLELEAAIVSGKPNEIAFVAELCRVLEEELFDSLRALPFFRRQLQLHPDDTQTAEVVERIEAKRERWQEVVERYVTELVETEEPAFRSSLLMSAAETAWRFGRSDEAVLKDAINRLEGALGIDRHNLRAAALLETIYRQQGRWADAAKVLAVVGAEGSKDDRVAALLRLGKLCAKRLQDKAAAVAAYRQVLDLAPGHEAATSFLTEHFSESEAWDDLIGLYEDQLKAGVIRGGEEVGAFLQIGMLHWRMKGKPDAAEPWFEKLRRAVPAHGAALNFFREWCEQKNQRARLITILSEAQRAMPDGPDRAAIAGELARFAEDDANAGKAIEQYKAMLRADPSNRDAREALKRLYTQTEAWNALVDILKQEIDKTPQDQKEDRLRLLRDISRLYKLHVKSDTALVTVLTQIVQLDEHDVEAVRELVRVYEALSRWRDLLTFQQKLADLIDDPTEKINLYRAVARRWLEQFSNVGNGVEAFEALLRVDPRDDEARTKLRELYSKRRSWAQLFALSEREVDFLDGKARVELLIEMAKLAAERLDRGADAIRLYKLALESDDQAPGVLDALEKQAEREKDFATVAEVLERRVDAAADENARLNVLQKLGAVYADRLNDPTGAARAWRRVLLVQPTHAKALRTLRDLYLASGDLESLEELYAAQDDWEGLAEVLSSAADKTTDEGQKVAFSLRSAKVFEDRLRQPERAFRAYERILSVQPDDERSARSLVPIYEKEERWARLPALYEILLKHAPGTDEKVALYRRLAEVTGQKINEKATAVAHARKAYELSPEAEGALDFLEGAVRAAGAWSELTEAIKWRLESGGEALSVSDRRPLRAKLADVYASQLGKVDEAVDTYRALVEEDPTDQEIVSTLDHILRSVGRKDDLRWLFELRASIAVPKARVRLFDEWATLEEEVFNEAARAIELYRRVLAISAEDSVALAALARLLLASGDAVAAVDVVARRRDLAVGQERAERELDLAELYAGPLAQPAEALAASVRAIELSPGDARGIKMLERLLEVPSTRPQAARVLQVEYERGGEGAKEAGALGVMLDTATEPGERLDLYGRLADVHEKKLSAPATALGVVLRAVTEFPVELPLWDRAGELAGAAGQFESLAASLSEALAKEATQPVEVELCERAAAIHDEKLGDPPGAVPYLNRVLTREPSNDAAFQRLKRILTTTGRWPELEALYEKATEAAADAGRKVELLADMALVCQDITDDKPKAIAYYERVLGLDPFHEQSLRALDSLYQQEKRPRELSKLLERRLESASDSDRVVLKLRLGRIHLESLDEPETALSHLDEVLRLDPTNTEARELIERIVGVPELRPRAAEVLERVYEILDDPANLVRALEIRLESAQGDDLRRELLRRVAQLRDQRLRDDAGTLEALARLVPLDPVDSASRERLQDVAGKLDAHPRAASVLLAAADAAQGRELKAEIMMEVARIYQQALQDLARAEEIYRRVVELDPTDPQLVLPAARLLERIYEASGNPKALAETLRLEVKLEASSDTRRDLWARLGDLCETVLEDSPGAIAAWRARLEEDPADERSLGALERLYERTAAWGDLVQTLRTKEQVSTDQDERRRLMVKAAETLAGRLNDTDGAINAWRAVTDEFGPDRPTLAALAALYEKAEQWHELANILETDLSLTDDPDAKLALYARLGDVRRQHLDDLPGALESYRQSLLLNPSHPQSRLALEILLEVPAARRDAASILHPLYEADGDFDHLLRVLDIEVETAESPSERLDSLDKAVRTSVGPLGDAMKAFAYARRGVREAVSDPSLQSWLNRIESLAASTGKYAELVEVLAEVSSEVLDEDIQLQVRLRVAELARVQLGNRELARDWYKKALELRSDDRTALTALESLYEEMADAPALLDILKRRVEVASDDSERRALLYRQAKLTREVVADRSEAVRVYEAILELGLDAPAVMALELLYAEEARFQDLVSLYERQLSENVGDKAELHVKLASVVERNLNDVPRAFEELDAALNVNYQHPGAIAALERLLEQAEAPEDRARAGEMLEPVYLRRADWKSVMRALEARLSASQDPSERRTLLKRLAQLHEEQEENYRAALDTTAKLLHEDLADESTWSELERLAKVAGAEDRLAHIYADELTAVSADEPHTAKLARRTGELFASLKDIDRALQFYRRALAFQPDSRELFGAVDGLLVNAGRAAERVELYRAALEHRFESADRLATLHIIADLEENALREPDKAIDTYRAAVEVEERDARSLDALTRLYRARQRWRDLADLYLRRAELETDGEASATFRLSLARLYKNELQDVSSSIDQLEQIVSAMPWHREAIAELELLTDNNEFKARVVEILNPLYARADDWRNLIRLAEQRLALAQEPGEKIAIYREAARLYEDRASDKKQSFDMIGKAFLLDPEDQEVRAELDRLAEQLVAWDALSDTYEQAISAAEPHAQRDLLLALAKVHDVRRDDLRKALVAYDRLHRLDENDLEPLEAMDSLSMMLADWPIHVRVLNKKAELVGGDEDRAALHRRVGGTKRDMMDDDAGAIEAYEKAFELEPGSVFTADALIDLYERKEDAARLVDLYRRRVEMAPDDEVDLKYDLLSRMARRYEGALSQRREAIEALREALSVKPNDKPALQWLDRLFREEQMWPDLLENLRLQAATAETLQERVQLRRAMGDLHRLRLDDPLEALECYRQVLDEAPNDDASIQAVREIGEAQADMRAQAADILDPVLRGGGRWADLVGVLELRLKALSDPLSRAQTLRTAAIVHELNLNDLVAAEKALLRALADAPDDEEIHNEIERLAATNGWASYADALAERAANMLDARVAQGLNTRLGKIAEEHLKDDARAISAFRAALDQAGDDAALLVSLDRLYTRTSDAKALGEILERRVSIEQDAAARADLLHRLAVIQIKSFKDPRAGLSTLRACLDSRLDHPGAREALEGLTENADLFEETAELLEQVYRSLGDFSHLADLLDKRVSHAAPRDRTRLRLDLARVLEEQAHDSKRAQTSLEAALQDDPSDPDVLSNLERLMAINGAFASGAAALDKAISAATNLGSEEARNLFVRLAEWYRDRISDKKAAESAFERALSKDPESLDILKALEELRRAPGRERELVDTLRRRAKLELDLDKKKELLREAKTLAEGPVGDDALAEATLRQLLEENEADTWALDQLTALREKAGDWKEATKLLLRAAELVLDGNEVTKLRHRAAEHMHQKLNDKSGATKIYEDLFENDPSDSKASGALRALYDEANKTAELSRLLVRLIDYATSPADRTTLRLELARMQANKLKNLADAIEILKAVLEEEPGQTSAVVDLSQLYEKSGKDDELASLLNSQIELAQSRSDVSAELAFKVRLGEIYETRLKDANKAIATYQAVLEKDAKHKGALSAIARLHLAKGNLPEAIKALDARLELESGEVAIGVALQLAEAHTKQKNDEGAQKALEHALGLDGARLDVRTQLRTLYERKKEWQKLADLIAGDGDAAATPADKIKLYRQAAEIHRDKRADAASAAVLLDKASALAPDDRELLLSLCDAYSSSGRGKDAIKVLERIRESYGGKRSKDLASVLQRLAQAYLAEGDKDKALSELDAAFKLDPGSVATLRDLGVLTLDMGDLDRAQKTFRALLLQKLDGPSPITKAEVFYYLGEISHRQNDKPKAIQMLERAVENDANLAKAKELLAKLKG